MAYDPTNWVSGDIITKERLNKIEEGIAGLETNISTIENNIAEASTETETLSQRTNVLEEKINTLEKNNFSCEKTIKLIHCATNNTTTSENFGLISTGMSRATQDYCYPGFIKIEGATALKFTVSPYIEIDSSTYTAFRIFFFDKDFNRIKANASREVLEYNEDNSIFEQNPVYIRCVYYNTIKYLPYAELKIEAKGINDISLRKVDYHSQAKSAWEEEGFLKINYEVGTPEKIYYEDGSFKEFKGIYNTGRVMLPPNYTVDGDPCPVILFVHGSHSYYTSTDSSSPTNDNGEGVYIPYWHYLRDNGYIVIDCWGWTSKYQKNNIYNNPVGEGQSNPWPIPTTVQAYKSLVDYVTTYFNADKNNMFVMCKSLGGYMGTYMLKTGKFKAGCLLAPAMAFLNKGQADSDEDGRNTTAMGYNNAIRAVIAKDLKLNNTKEFINYNKSSLPQTSNNIVLENEFNKGLYGFKGEIYFNDYYRTRPNDDAESCLQLEIKEAYRLSVEMENQDSDNIKEYLWEYYNNNTGYKCWVPTSVVGWHTNKIDTTMGPSRKNIRYHCKMITNDNKIYYSKPVIFKMLNNNSTGIPVKADKYVNFALDVSSITQSGDVISYLWQSYIDNNWEDTSFNTTTEPTLRIKTASDRNGRYYRCKIEITRGQNRKLVYYSKLVHMIIDNTAVPNYNNTEYILNINEFEEEQISEFVISDKFVSGESIDVSNLIYDDELNLSIYDNNNLKISIAKVNNENNLIINNNANNWIGEINIEQEYENQYALNRYINNTFTSKKEFKEFLMYNLDKIEDFMISWYGVSGNTVEQKLDNDLANKHDNFDLCRTGFPPITIFETREDISTRATASEEMIKQLQNGGIQAHMRWLKYELGDSTKGHHSVDTHPADQKSDIYTPYWYENEPDSTGEDPALHKNIPWAYSESIEFFERFRTKSYL